ncbi:MAG: hypothetical protein ABI808_03750, partial [Pseudonocardiales bacterium]
MTAVGANAGLIDRLRARVLPEREGTRFVDRPYASVQLLLLAGVGLLGFGVLMSVSTTIAASHSAGGAPSMWAQMIKEAEFVAIGLP